MKYLGITTLLALILIATTTAFQISPHFSSRSRFLDHHSSSTAPLPPVFLRPTGGNAIAEFNETHTVVSVLTFGVLGPQANADLSPYPPHRFEYQPGYALILDSKSNEHAFSTQLSATCTYSAPDGSSSSIDVIASPLVETRRDKLHSIDLFIPAFEQSGKYPTHAFCKILFDHRYAVLTHSETMTYGFEWQYGVLVRKIDSREIHLGDNRGCQNAPKAPNGQNGQKYQKNAQNSPLTSIPIDFIPTSSEPTFALLTSFPTTFRAFASSSIGTSRLNLTHVAIDRILVDAVKPARFPTLAYSDPNYPNSLRLDVLTIALDVNGANNEGRMELANGGDGSRPFNCVYWETGLNSENHDQNNQNNQNDQNGQKAQTISKSPSRLRGSITATLSTPLSPFTPSSFPTTVLVLHSIPKVQTEIRCPIVVRMNDATLKTHQMLPNLSWNWRTATYTPRHNSTSLPSSHLFNQGGVVYDEEYLVTTRDQTSSPQGPLPLFSPSLVPSASTSLVDLDSRFIHVWGFEIGAFGEQFPLPSTFPIDSVKRDVLAIRLGSLPLGESPAAPPAFDLNKGERTTCVWERVGGQSERERGVLKAKVENWAPNAPLAVYNFLMLSITPELREVLGNGNGVNSGRGSQFGNSNGSNVSRVKISCENLSAVVPREVVVKGGVLWKFYFGVAVTVVEGEEFEGSLERFDTVDFETSPPPVSLKQEHHNGPTDPADPAVETYYIWTSYREVIQDDLKK